MKTKLNRNKFRILGWLSVVAILLLGSLKIPYVLSYIRSQGEVITTVRKVLDMPVTEASLLLGTTYRDANNCYVTRSPEEISRIITALRSVRQQFFKSGTGRKQPFVVALRLEDDSRAHFLLHNRADDISRVYLDKFEHAQSRATPPEIWSATAIEIRHIGDWAAAVIEQNSCH